ncbi:MAG: hypothetical protein Q8O07_07075, partial [Chloroflexota bacterium]|nr:hypothetical protein [Chloroflexota bacterium]
MSPPAQPLSALRPMEWARDVPCDTLRKAYEEVYQVDTLAAAAQNSAQQLRDQGFDASAQLKRLDARRVTADRLYQGDIVALSAFSNQGKAVRYQMNKVYAALQETRAERQRLIVLGWVLAASLFVLSSLFLGWRHTLKGQGKAKHSRMSLVWMVLACLVVFVLFATPLFGVAPPTPETTEEETERQNAVDQVSRVSDAAGRLSAQVWAIGNVGARWSALDQTQGSAALAMAIQSARDKETNLAAYWGQTQAVRESATSWRESTQDLALYRTDRLEAAASQSWHLRALAAGWIDVDKARSAELLNAALAANRQSPIAVYRDLELRAIAVTYARLDPARAGALLDQVSDPFLRAWGLREMGAYGQATEAARQVQDPYKRAWALRKIAEALPANATSLLIESIDAAARIEDKETQAYALADI